MGLLSLNLPVIGQSSATEDQKVRDALSSVQTLLNGNVDEANVPNLAAAFTTWKTVAWGGGAVNSGIVTAAGTYVLWGGPPLNAGTQNSPGLVGAANSGGAAFYIDPVDWTANARINKMRLRAQCITNATPPAITYTVGLYPVATFGGATGANPTIATVGAVVTGSTAAFATPAGATSTVTLSTDFNAPAAGAYMIGLLASGLPNANANTLFVVQMQIRQV